MSIRALLKPVATLRNFSQIHTAFLRSFTQDTLRQNGLSPEMIEKIQRRDQELREEYYALHGHFDDVTDPATGKITYNDALRKRLIFRSKQRGMLEVDLLLGKWATLNVPKLTPEELKQYELILNSETTDIFSWITSKSPVPPEIDSPIMKQIQQWVKSAPFGYASPETYEENKKLFTN